MSENPSQSDIIVFFREVLRNAGAVPESAIKLARIAAGFRGLLGHARK